MSFFSATILKISFISLAISMVLSPFVFSESDAKPWSEYRSLYNHDGLGAYSLSSVHQPDNRAPLSIQQINGYVDEVADAGIDVLLLCPNLLLLPGWNSDHDPYWREEGKDRDFIATAGSMGRILARAQDFITSGGDLIELTSQRAEERGLAFFLTWRMSDMQYLERPDSPSASPFWTNNPHLRIGGPDIAAGDGNIGNRPLLALNFAHEEVRDYKFGFLNELCRRYTIDGLELDFLRFPYFFPADMPFEEKAALMNDFVERVRNLLDDLQLEIPLSVRIGGNFEINRQAGLDVETWVEKGWVDILNLSASMHTAVDHEIERFRKKIPDVMIFGEIAHIASHRRVESGRERWHIPREVMYASAQSFLSRGADGISIWNYVYSRARGVEPDMDALKGISDPDFLSVQDKHYHLNPDNSHLFRAAFGGRKWSRQMPFSIAPFSSSRFSIPVGDENPARTFSFGVLRIYSSDNPLRKMPIEVYINHQSLESIVMDGVLSVSPVAYEGIPSSNEGYRDYRVPLELIQQGWNTFEVFLNTDQRGVEIEEVELRFFREKPL